MEEIKLIREFLIDRDAIKLNKIETDLKFPERTVARIKSGERNQLSKHRLKKLVTYLAKYGFSLEKQAA